MQQVDEKKMNYTSMVKTFSEIARKGLNLYYKESMVNLPYTTRPNGYSNWNLIGKSIRYAAICQIGINKWITHHPDDKTELPDLWPAILSQIPNIQDVGDAALCLWAAADSRSMDADKFANLLVNLWPDKKYSCNAVELGWIVQAGTLCLQAGQRAIIDIIKPILDESHRMLKGLFHPKTGLFQRHCRGGRFSIQKRIACFADQVYPIIAMSTYGQVFDDRWSKQAALSAMESICKHQGSLGQWMWHYDVEDGKVCEEYPVFSVHQHAMAPMAILIADEVNNSDHTKQLELGMCWLFGNNELGQNLVCPEEGIIWRDIERKEPFKMSRLFRGASCVFSLERTHRWLKTSPLGYKVNYECRPYELGWILYAWADYKLKD